MMGAYGFAKTNVVAGGISILLMAGCSPVASSYLGDAPPPNGKLLVGEVYSLPVKTMSVSVGSDSAGVFVAVHSVQVEADASARYVLSYNGDSSSADSTSVKYDADKGLLTSVKAEADSKIADAGKAFAKSAGQIAGSFESGVGQGALTYQTKPLTYWPRAGMTAAEAKAELAQFNAQVNAMLRDVIAVHGCGLKDERVLPADKRRAFCTQSGGVREAQIPLVTLDIDYAPYMAQAAGTDCAIGICTRVQSMAELTLTTRGFRQAARVPLPNGSSPVPLPLRREAFAKATTEYTLVDGLLTASSYEKGAALPEILAFPGSLIGSFIGGIVDGVAEAGKLRQAKRDAASSKAGPKDEKPEAGDIDTASTAPIKPILVVYPLPQLPKATPAALPGAASPPAQGGTTPPPGSTKTSPPGPALPDAGAGVKK